jgi:hypothetical protein
MISIKLGRGDTQNAVAPFLDLFAAIIRKMEIRNGFQLAPCIVSGHGNKPTRSIKRFCQALFSCVHRGLEAGMI